MAFKNSKLGSYPLGNAVYLRRGLVGICRRTEGKLKKFASSDGNLAIFCTKFVACVANFHFSFFDGDFFNIMWHYWEDVAAFGIA